MRRTVYESTDGVSENLDDILEKGQVRDDPYRSNKK
jgi:hypothetical protein